MCGIVGYSGRQDACERIMSALSALEYRGYDSAGIAVWHQGEVQILKRSGRLENLAMLLAQQPHSSTCGIGHTRWATHGSPTDTNAHPHRSGQVTLVHNGIIENYTELREKLHAAGKEFLSETDTEIAAALLDSFYDGDPTAAIRSACGLLDGSYAFAILFADRPGEIYALRKGSPLIAAVDADGAYLASDLPALLPYTNRYYLLEQGEIARLDNGILSFFTFDGTPIEKNLLTANWTIDQARKDGYDYFMLKEIDEQPAALENTVLARIRDGLPCFEGELPEGLFRNLRKIHIAACGTAYHAGVIGRTLIERMARIPVEVEVASEFRYRDPIIGEGELGIIISQSGETADTLAAQRLFKERGVPTIGIINVVGSSIARKADYCLYTYAGPEIAVASTKAYSVQIGMLYLLAITIAGEKGVPADQCRRWTEELTHTIRQLPDMLRQSDFLQKEYAAELKNAESMFYIGRGLDYALALEGSLKLKEISYIHSDAYAAGELKHGTISLIVPGTPVIALATQRELLGKTISNVKETKARGARVLLIVNGDAAVDSECCDHLIRIPQTADLFAPLLAIIALQLIAAGAAIVRGCDVDKPRNLAKSVTVE